MKKAVFAGSFSPPTLGHLDLIQRAAKLCDQLIVAVATNGRKSPSFFSVEEKKTMLIEVTKTIPNLQVISFSGLLSDFVQKEKINCLIRGLRSISHFYEECAMAYANRQLCGVETVFLMGDERYSFISSSLIREIASLGGRLTPFVPPALEKQILQKFGKTISP